MALAILLIHVSDWTFQASWTTDQPQPPSTRVSTFGPSFLGTSPVLAPDVFLIHPPLKLLLAKAGSNLCCSRGQGRTGLELKHLMSVNFLYEALFYQDLSAGYQITQCHGRPSVRDSPFCLCKLTSGSYLPLGLPDACTESWDKVQVHFVNLSLIVLLKLFGIQTNQPSILISGSHP